MDRSGTQSRKLGAEVPASGLQQWKSEQQEQREAADCGSVAARLSQKGQSPESGTQTGKTVTKRDIKRAPAEKQTKTEREKETYRTQESERKENSGLFGETRSWATQQEITKEHEKDS